MLRRTLIAALALSACGRADPSLIEGDRAALVAAGPVRVGFNPPESPRDFLGEDMIAFIQTATGTLDLALYDLTHRGVLAAMLDAHARGLRVRMVSDSIHRDQADAAPIYDAIEGAGIPVAYDFRSADMHHKFIVRDGQAVWMGSYNALEMPLTHAENAVVIEDRAVARAFAREFAEMFVEGKFSNDKADDTEHHFVVNGEPLEVYFAPRDGVEERVVTAIRSAEVSIHFLSFSFSADPLAEAMLARHAAGVPVEGVVDILQANKAGGDFDRLLAAGMDVRKAAFSTFMHNKVLIIDAGTPRAHVITGSYNFTYKADYRNDESIVILHSPAAVDMYLSAFEQIFGRCAPLNGDGSVGRAFKITEVHANAYDESTGEYVEIVNTATVPATLEGLYLYDGDAWDRVIPYDGGSYTVDAGAVVVILDPDYDASWPIAPSARLFTVENRTLGDGLTNNDPVMLYAADRVTLIDSFSFPANPGDAHSIVRTSAFAPDAAESWVFGGFNFGSAGIYPEPMDLNTADVVALDTLPGIGPSLANAIVADRAQNGAFCRTEDLLRVSGVGASKLAGIGTLALARGAIGCEIPAPTVKVNINTADAVTLDTLPHIGPSLAAAIVTDRELNGPFPTIDALTRVSGIGAATLADLRDLITVE